MGTEHVVTETEGSSTDVAVWFRTAYPRLRRFAAVVAPPNVAPDDLVQDALVRILRLGSIDGLEDPTAYLCRTMANLASDRRRRWRRGQNARARLGALPPGVESTYPSDLSDLSLLTPRERATVYLHDVEGFRSRRWRYSSAVALPQHGKPRCAVASDFEMSWRWHHERRTASPCTPRGTWGDARR